MNQRIGLWTIVIPLIPFPLTAQDPEVRDVAAAYEIRLAESAAPLELHREPLLNWTNPERLQERGGLFVWMQAGRPEVIGTIFTFALGERFLEKHEFHSLSDSTLTATYQEGVVWKPETPGLQWRSLEDVAPRAAPLRLTRMRALSREFKFTLRRPRDDLLTALRPMPQPLLRYSSPGRGIVDGAIFSYVVATDPEALLIVEALEEREAGEQAKRLRWRYAFARMHFWEVTAVDAEGRQVWNVPHEPGLNTNRAGGDPFLDGTYNLFYPSEQVLGSPTGSRNE